jgi:protein required for attachment to host cells
MEKIEVKAGDWVVVCDGRKALILENQGDEKFPNLRTRDSYEHENPRTHEQGTDKPGRIQQSAAPGGSAVEQTDWHDQSEQEFLKSLASRLDKELQKDGARSLIIVAAPRALGMLRPEYSHAIQSSLKAEVSKDMVNMPVYEIEKKLTGHA